MTASTSFRWITAVTSLAFVVAQLDVSIVNIALPEIAKTFKADMSVLQWVIDAYALAFAVLMLSAGNLSDLFGAKHVFQYGMLIFGAASIGCGFAGTAGMLIVWWVLQGRGAAIDSVLKSLHNVIIATPNLIIDLRDCQGGSDQSFYSLIPYLYTNPIRSVMTEFYSTPRNNQMWKEIANREGLDPEEKNTYLQIADLMNSKPGQFVNIFGKDVDVTTMSKVLPYPQNIGIIIHENNFSTTEEFILKAKQSKKVKFFGRKTGGALDVSNMIEPKSPDGNFIFEYCISRSLRIPAFPVDDMGLHPDFYLDRSIPETDWVDYTATILNSK